MTKVHDKIIDSYKENSKTFISFTKSLEKLISDLIEGENINYHKLESRTKNQSSLQDKLNRKHDKYKDIYEITDVIGLRIITFFDDDVGRIANLLEKEFHVDKENTIDKRAIKTDNFGYSSLHYVLLLGASRNNLSENKKYKGIKFEVQIRTILQHAWAEIEHDIGYKSELELPSHLRRNFNRVAALLETADIEFLKIKNELEKYTSEVPQLMKSHKEDVEINYLTLNSFVLSSPDVRRIDEKMMLENNCKLHDGHKISNSILKICESLQIKTINSLNELLISNESKILNFFREYNKQIISNGVKTYMNGISIFYLGYYLIGISEFKPLIDIYIRNVVYSNSVKDKMQIEIIRTQILNTIKRIEK